MDFGLSDEQLAMRDTARPIRRGSARPALSAARGRGSHRARADRGNGLPRPHRDRPPRAAWRARARERRERSHRRGHRGEGTSTSPTCSSSPRSTDPSSPPTPVPRSPGTSFPGSARAGRSSPSASPSRGEGPMPQTSSCAPARTNSGYVLNGREGIDFVRDPGRGSDRLRREPGSRRRARRGISAFVVPLDSPGVAVSGYEDVGSAAVGRGSIFFEDVEVPAERMLAEENTAFRTVMSGFDYSRALIGLQCLAAAEVSLRETWTYATEREAFGAPIVRNQGVSGPLAEAETWIEAAKLLCYKTLWLRDRGEPHTAEAAMCKWWAPKVAFDVIHRCLLTPRTLRLHPRHAVRAAPARRDGTPDRGRDEPGPEDDHRPRTRGAGGPAARLTCRTVDLSHGWPVAGRLRRSPDPKRVRPEARRLPGPGSPPGRSGSEAGRAPAAEEAGQGHVPPVRVRRDPLVMVEHAEPPRGKGR